MPIDTSIYNQLLRPPKTVAEYDAEAMAGQQNRLALQMGQQKADEYQRGVADSNKLRGVVAGFGADQTANYNALLGAGRLDEAQKYQKANADLTKTGAETAHLAGQTQKDKFGVIVQANGLVGSAAGAIMQNPDYNHAVGIVSDLKTKLGPELAKQLGLDTLQIPQDPAQLKAWANDHYLGSIDTAKQLEDARVKSEGLATRQNAVQINAATNATARANNAATVGATIRGQDMTNDRAKEAATAGKVPAGYRANPDGSLAFIPGGPADPNADKGKPLNDSQSKALLFGTRMQESNKVLAKLEAEGTTTSVPGSRMPGIGGTINAMSSGNRQMLDQAKRDFMTAVLRRESGAAISPGEFDTADKQYFPQVGDSAQVIKQKARNRDLAINGVLVEVPEKQRKSITPVTPGMPDDIAALLSKHGGK